ncbi:MAG: hypothetical protein K0B00_12845 [Rhodobacteraceae bacterium]|nr:hypothetical protein [Paracoccaceae bacterium]
MSDSGPSTPKDEDPLIAQWRAKRALETRVDLAATAESGGTAPPEDTTAAHANTTDPAQRVDDSSESLLAIAEGLLAGPKAALTPVTPIALDTIPERGQAPRTGSTERAGGQADHSAPRFDDIKQQVRPETEFDPARATANAVAAAFAGTQATTHTHIPGGNEIEEARALMHARLRKRRAQSFGLFALTVVIPVLVMLTYLQLYVTPLYETRAVIAISQPNQQGQSGGGGVLGALGGGPGMSQAFKADEYVRSQVLPRDLADPRWAPRLAAAGISPGDLVTQMGAAKTVDSSIDIQAGLMTVYARMATPEQAVALSGVVLDLISDHVEVLGAQLGDQRLSVASNSVDTARNDLLEARSDLVELQISAGDVDPVQRVFATYSRIAEIEMEISDLQGQIDHSAVAGANETYETQRLRALIDKLKDQADTSRRSLVDRDGDGDSKSLNQLLMDFELAAQNVKIAEETLSSALSAWSRAQAEVALERSVMQVVVPAVTPQSPRYPRLLVSLFITAIIGMAVFFTLRMALLDPE